MNGSPPRIYAPIISGSGVRIIHDALARAISGYQVRALRPAFGLLPASTALLRHGRSPLTHSTPELGDWIAPNDSVLVATFHNYYTDSDYAASVDSARRAYYRVVLRDSIRRSLRRARVVTAVSQFTANLVRREIPMAPRLVVIRNGVDTELFCPGAQRDGHRIRILFAGNPIRRKGIEYLAALADQMPTNVELCYTSGMRSSALATPARHGRLIAIPARSHAEMPALYQSSDILFFPTIREGFGLVAAEAMACGLPVVATDCSSIPELVVHGQGGFLFEAGNREQMREQLLRVASDAALRRDMGQFNRARVLEQFPLQRMLKEYRQLFTTLGVSC